jgi:hypothetical protein
MDLNLSPRTAVVLCVAWTLFAFVFVVLFVATADSPRASLAQALTFGLVSVLVNAVGSWLYLRRRFRR